MNTINRRFNRRGVVRAHVLLSAGVTLTELLVAISIAAVLLALAVPAFDSITTSSRLTSASNDLLASLYLARSEAIKRNGRAVVCKSADGESCTTAGYWDQGWIVFADANNDAQRDTGETLILSVPALNDSLSMRGYANVASYVSYAPVGASQLTSGAFQAGTITICRVSASGGETREIVLSATGRPRVSRGTASSCP